MSDEKTETPIEAAAETPEQKSERLREARNASLVKARSARNAARLVAKEIRQKNQEAAAAEAPADKPFTLDPDLADMLSEKELREIEVQAKMQVAAEVKAKRKKEALDRALVRARAAAGILSKTDKEKEWQAFMDEEIPITLYLAEYTDRIVLDGTIYIHGRTYTVTRAKYETLMDQMAQTWRHQDELDGKRKNYYNERHGWMTVNGSGMTGTYPRAL